MSYMHKDPDVCTELCTGCGGMFAKTHKLKLVPSNLEVEWCWRCFLVHVGVEKDE